MINPTSSLSKRINQENTIRNKEDVDIPASSFSDFSIKGGSFTTLSNLVLLKGSSFGM